MSRICIKDINIGENICSIFLVGAVALAESKNGLYWRLELKDATGTLEAKIWSPLSQKFNEIKTGDFVEVKGKVSLFREQKQLSIEALRFVNDSENLNYADFLQSSAVKPSILLSQLEELVFKELTYAPWKTFVKSVLNDATIREKLLMASAAKSVHHAYIGGLLEHTLSVAKLCIKISEHYFELDKELLLVAAIFHDIGKIEELSSGITCDYTNEGKLLGHIIQGILMLKPFLDKAKVDKDLAIHFEHLILSHHGELEYGAPKVPMTAEAFVLHYADNMDAKLAQMRELLSELPAQKTKNNSDGLAQVLPEITWTPWVNLLGRNLCQMPKTPMKSEKLNKKVEKDDQQGSLI